MTDEEYLAKLDEINKLPDEEGLKELANLPLVDIWENYKDEHHFDPEDLKYQIEGFEDYFGARNIV